jgi:hypothetical protein
MSKEIVFSAEQSAMVAFELGRKGNLYALRRFTV